MKFFTPPRHKKNKKNAWEVAGHAISKFQITNCYYNSSQNGGRVVKLSERLNTKLNKFIIF